MIATRIRTAASGRRRLEPEEQERDSPPAAAARRPVGQKRLQVVDDGEPLRRAGKILDDVLPAEAEDEADDDGPLEDRAEEGEEGRVGQDAEAEDAQVAQEGQRRGPGRDEAGGVHDEDRTRPG